MTTRTLIAVALAVVGGSAFFASPAAGKTYSAQGDSGHRSERHARIAELGYMVGIWEIRSTERASDGQFLEEQGTRSCVWALNRTAIRCDDSLTRTRASQRYLPVGKQRRLLFYLTYNDVTGKYEYTYMTPDSSEKDIFEADYDPVSGRLTNSSPMDPLGRDRSVMTHTVQWRLSDDEIRQQSSVAGLNSDYTEVFDAVLNRRVAAGNSAGHF